MLHLDRTRREPLLRSQGASRRRGPKRGVQISGEEASIIFLEKLRCILKHSKVLSYSRESDFHRNHRLDCLEDAVKRQSAGALWAELEHAALHRVDAGAI